MDAVNILPAEMWMEIIGNLKDPKDWLSCYNTCTLFQDHMEKDKVTALLPAVLSSLEERQNSSPTYPTNLKLGSEDMKNLRLVSKSWKDIVDQHVSNHTATQDLVMFNDLFHGYHFIDHFEMALPVSIDIKNPEASKKITEILESWSRSNAEGDAILPSRHLVVSNLPFEQPIIIIDEDHEMGEHLEEMDDAEGSQDPPLLQLLRKIGKTIWHFGISGSYQEFHQPARMEEWFKVVRQCLLLLPNLKSLYITQPNFGSRDPNFDFVFHYNTNFPHLPDLEVFQCDGLDHKFIQCLLLPNNHIKKLSINGSLANNALRRFNTVNFKNLTEVAVATLLDSDWIEYIKLCESAKLPLTKLSFRHNQFRRVKPIPAERLFAALKPFGASLTHLSIGLMPRPSTGVIRVSANLPKLRFLELDINGRSENRVRVEFVYPFDNQKDCTIILNNIEGSNVLAE